MVPSLKQGVSKVGGSGDSKAAFGAGAGALRDVAHCGEGRLRGLGEGAAEPVGDIRNVVADDPSLIAGGASTDDPVAPDEAVVGKGAGESDNLPINGWGSQGRAAGTHSTRQAHGSQSIETL